MTNKFHKYHEQIEKYQMYFICNLFECRLNVYNFWKIDMLHLIISKKKCLIHFLKNISKYNHKNLVNKVQFNEIFEKF